MSTDIKKDKGLLTDTPEFMKGSSSLPKLDVFEFILMEEKFEIVMNEYILDKLKKDMLHAYNCEFASLILRTFLYVIFKIRNLLGTDWHDRSKWYFSCIQDTSCQLEVRTFIEKHSWLLDKDAKT